MSNLKAGWNGMKPARTGNGSKAEAFGTTPQSWDARQTAPGRTPLVEK
jgi:hypothetical protein